MQGSRRTRWNTRSTPLARSLRIGAALLVAALLTACVSKSRFDEMADENYRLQRQLDTATQRANQLEGAVEVQAEQIVATQATYDALVTELTGELAAGQVTIEQLRDGIRVQMAQDVLFATGSASLGDDGRKVIERVSDELAAAPYEILVEGNSDDTPIRGALAERYPSNWELAAARAARVVRLLQENGVDGAKLAAVSFGQERPVASNETDEGRAQNRRIDIRLVPLD